MPGLSNKELSKDDLHDRLKEAMSVGFLVGSGQASRDRWLFAVLAVVLTLMVLMFLDYRKEIKETKRELRVLQQTYWEDPKEKLDGGD